MPYAASLASADAVLYAARPGSDLFTLSGAATLEVDDNGTARLQPSAAGTRQIGRIAAKQQGAAVQALVEVIAAQPAAPPAGRGGPPQP